MKALFAILLSVSMLSTAQANTYLNKLSNYVNSGDLQGLTTQDLSAYHAMVSQPTRYVEVYSQQANAKANGETVTILASRTPVSDAIIAVQVLLVTKVHPAIAKQIQSLPATYAMHGDPGEPGMTSLTTSGLKEIAFDVLSNLIDNGLTKLVTVDHNGNGLGNVYFSINQNATLGIKSILEEVLVEQFVSRKNYEGTVESVNARIKIGQDSALFNTFRIELAFPAKAKDKEIKAVFQEIINSIN